jgi:hypothetical protein
MNDRTGLRRYPLAIACKQRAVYQRGQVRTYTKMAVTNCICLKFGALYGPEYVNRLYAGLRRNTGSDLRFFCMTDDARGIWPGVEIIPLPHEPFHDRMFALMKDKGWRAPFQKISMFRPGLIPDLNGPLLVFDIDIVITGDIDALRDYAPGKLCMRREWGTRPGIRSLGHGSVEKLDPAKHSYLYDFMAENPEAALMAFGASEQNYTSLSAERAGDFAFFPDEWIVSFKYDCRPKRPLNLIMQPRLPLDARVVCFHGRPKMEEAVEGYRAGPLHSTRPCTWMRDAWIGTAQDGVLA